MDEPRTYFPDRVNDLERLRVLSARRQIKSGFARIIDRVGPDHSPTFSAYAAIVTNDGSRYIGEANASSSMGAKLEAAKHAIEALKAAEPDHPISVGPPHKRRRRSRGERRNS